MANPEDMRIAIASQKTVPASLTALLYGITSLLNDATTSTDPAAVGRVVDWLGSNTKACVDAVMANTNMALETATLTTPVPAHVAGMFTAPAAPATEPEPENARNARDRHITDTSGEPWRDPPQPEAGSADAPAEDKSLKRGKSPA